MNYGDFSSVVQLGVGLHAGSVLLQLYGEVGMQPLVRRLERMRSLFSAPGGERLPEAIRDDLEQLESKFEIFKIQLFHEYKKYIAINSVLAFVLAIVLVVFAFIAGKPVTKDWEWFVIIISFLSICPGPLTVAALWIDASRSIGPIEREADDLEKRALASK